MTPEVSTPSGFKPTLGVVVVTYNSADVILDCLESLLHSRGVRLVIAVIDNVSEDGTPDLVRDWAAGRHAYAPPGDLPVPLIPARKPVALRHVSDGAIDGQLLPGEGPDNHRLALLETGVNGGFAAGVNHGLAYLARVSGLERFWILNPDGIPAPDTARLFATAPGGPEGFALMSGRILYLDGRNDSIQSDGGILRRTGVSASWNKFLRHPETPDPNPAGLAFLSGASLVVSRAFYETAGPMPEDYFLYYEEVDWAMKRGDLPLDYCPGFTVYHWGGTAIGSPIVGRSASPFSLYFKHRGRMRFLRRFNPLALPVGAAYGAAQAARLLLRRDPMAAWTVLLATFGLTAPAVVRERLSPSAQAQIFGRT